MQTNGRDPVNQTYLPNLSEPCHHVNANKIVVLEETKPSEGVIKDIKVS